MRNPALLAVLLVALSTPTFAQKSTPQQGAPHAVPVTTVIAQERPVAQRKDFVGRIEAMERVDVRARVTGYLQAVLFEEGELVKEGQPLYRIEPDLFKAAVEQRRHTPPKVSRLGQPNRTRTKSNSGELA